MKLSTENLYRLCNKYQWFTSGDCTQYEKMFKRNKQGASLETLATIILALLGRIRRKTNIRNTRKGV